jgi:hypothetical protein
MMCITDQDVALWMELGIRYTCAKLRVPEFGVIDHGELLARIATKDVEVHRLLTDFLNSYKAWFEFHKEIDRQGKQGRLSAGETQQLMTLTERKDTTRARIVERLQSIPSA